MQRWGFKTNIPRIGVSQVPRLGYRIGDFKSGDENFLILHLGLPASVIHEMTAEQTIYSRHMSGVCRMFVDLFLRALSVARYD